MSQFSSPEELEKAHVRDVYDQIAPRFLSLQHKAWPKVTEFLRSLPTGSVIADVGCGPGKYLGLVPSSFIIGSDTCIQFVSTAREKQHEVCVCDNQLLPYRDGCFDAVISVGVIHHFASAKRRLGALRELARILRPGGRMLVYAWALEQSERKFNGQDVLVPYKGHHNSKDRGKRRKHICNFTSNDAKGREENGAREKCLCSVISHESLFENKERHRRTLQARDSSQHKLRADSNGSATKHYQEHQKTASNGHVCNGHVSNRHVSNRHVCNGHVSNGHVCNGHVSNGHVSSGHVSNGHVSNGHASNGYVSNVHARNSTAVASKEEATSTSKLGAFVGRVADKVFDSKERTDCNSMLERSSFVTGIHKKLRRLIPAQTDGESLHSNGFFNFLSSRIFKRNENGFSAGYVDHDQDSGTAPVCDPKLSEPFSSTFDGVSTQLEHKPSHAKFCNGCSSPVKGTSVDIGASKEESLSRESTNGIGTRLLARLLENISSSDTESDSSSSGDCVGADWSLLEENDISSVCGVPFAKKVFQHTTLCCQEFQVTSSSSADEFSPTCNGTEGSSGLCQRYYHVFHQGELAELIQQGVPSLEVVEEYYDHANWAIISVKN